jgi:hypothetical protein
MKKRLIQVSKIGNELPIKKSTLYVWHHLKRYPGIFVKIGSMLCVDIEQFYKTFEPGKAK